ncbi:MBL fold metallo-hydrolase [Kordiimonas aquimaris]|uniref:hypothetical protein n=1 Tax=Kordiimonas aquimaris TaxID=707591 RepID=UPI0021CFA971|nr:hypothetical protein [Kordiimonas aquimaris]
MKKFVSTALTGVCALALLVSSAVGAQINDVADKIAHAYSVDGMDAVNSISVKMEVSVGSLGQNRTPTLGEFHNMRIWADMDFSGERFSLEYFNDFYRSLHHFRFLEVDGKSHAIVYQSRALLPGASGAGSRMGELLPIVRTSDFLLAYMISKTPEKMEYLADEQFMGRVLSKYKFTLEGERVLYPSIDPETGLIAKVAMTDASTDTFYQFRDHANKGGLRFARQVDLYNNGRLVSYRRYTDVAVNDVSAENFELENSLRQMPGNIDRAAWHTDEVLPGVYHIGEGSTYSTFVDTGEYLIGVGALQRLGSRLDYFREQMGNQKPLKYMVASHHHFDHISGIKDLLDTDVKFIITPNTEQLLSEHVSPDFGEDRYEVVSSMRELGEGPNKVILNLLSTVDVSEVLLFQIPDKKAFVAADHYRAPYPTSQMRAATRAGVSLKNEITKLGLDFDYVINLHDPGKWTWEAFEESFTRFNEEKCPLNRPICRTPVE